MIGSVWDATAGTPNRCAAANTSIVFDYLAIVYVAIASYIALAQVPSLNTVAGAVLWVGGGLFIVWDETRLQKQVGHVSKTVG